MDVLIDEILTKLSELLEPRLREVLRFVDQMKQPNLNVEKTGSPEELLLSLAGMLSGEPLSAQAIEVELYDH